MGLLMRAARLLVAGAMGVGAAAAARATDVQQYNFNTGKAGWDSPLGEWLYTEQGSNEKSWKLPLTGTNPAVNYLYSPCFTITDTTVRFDLQEHRFSFGTSGTVDPLAYVPPAGQVQYRLDDGDWRGIPLIDWYPFVGPGSGADVPPTLDPAAFASGTATQLVPDGWAFQGVSRGYADQNPKFIRSAFEITGLPLDAEISFRLLGDLGNGSFPADLLHPIWDVNNVQIKGVVEGPCAPEPGALAASAVAAVSIGAWRGRCRWTRRRCPRSCSAPRETPAPAATG